jgi:hypothetical protein
MSPSDDISFSEWKNVWTGSDNETSVLKRKIFELVHIISLQFLNWRCWVGSNDDSLVFEWKDIDLVQTIFP